MTQFVIDPEKLTHLGERQRKLIDFYNSGKPGEIVTLDFEGFKDTVDKFKNKCQKAGLRKPRLYVVQRDNQVFLINADALEEE